MSGKAIFNLVFFSLLFLFIFAACVENYEDTGGGSFLWLDFSGRSGYGGFRGGGSGFGK